MSVNHSNCGNYVQRGVFFSLGLLSLEAPEANTVRICLRANLTHQKMELRDGERKRGPLVVHLEPAVPEAVPQNFQLCKPMRCSFLVEPVELHFCHLPQRQDKRLFCAKFYAECGGQRFFRSSAYSPQVYSLQGRYPDPREISLN